MRLGIRIKMIVLFSVITLLVLAANLTWFGRVLREEYKAALDDELLIIGDQVSSQLARITDLGIAVGDIENFDGICLEVVKKHSNIQAVMVADTEGAVLFHSNRYMRGGTLSDPRLLKVLREGGEGVHSVRENHCEFYYALVPFRRHADQPEYAILVSSPATLIDARVSRLVRTCNLISLTAFVTVAVLLLIGLQTMLTGPLNRILQTIGRIITYRDLRQRVQVRSTDEIGQLAASFNRMIEELEQSTASIEDLNIEIASRCEAQQQALLAGRKAREASRSKSEFLAGISREIRIPLEAIIAAGEALAGQADGAAQKQQARAIADSGRCLLELIDNILEYSRMETDEIEIHLQDCPLEDLLADIGTAAQRLARHKRIEFRIIRHESLPTEIVTDPVHLRRCLLHVIDAVVKLTGKGGMVLYVYPTPLSNALASPTLSFDIQEIGLGVEAEMVKVLNDSSDQTDSLCTRLGMGLAVPQKLIEHLGGRLLISNSPDQGVTFTVLLPIGHPAECPAV